MKKTRKLLFICLLIFSFGCTYSFSNARLASADVQHLADQISRQAGIENVAVYVYGNENDSIQLAPTPIAVSRNERRIYVHVLWMEFLGKHHAVMATIIGHEIGHILLDSGGNNQSTDELRADVLGLVLVDKIGLNPKNAATHTCLFFLAFEKMMERYGGVVAGSHPSASERCSVLFASLKEIEIK